MKNIHLKKCMNTIGVSLILMSLTSCVTGSKLTSSFFGEEQGANIFENSKDKVVVQKVGDSNPIISPYGRNHWIKARSSRVASIQRIQGLLATREYLEAERSARRFLSTHPGNIEGLTAISSALAMSGQSQLAAFYAALISKKLPGNPHSLNIQGLAILANAKRIQDYKRAENLFKKSFSTSESEIASGLNLGHLYLELGNSQAAYDVFESAARKCDDCIPAQMGMGVSARRNGQFSDALQAFNNVLGQNKYHAEALYHKALVYRDGLSDRSKAEQTLRDLLAIRIIKGDIKDRAHTLLRSMRAQREKTRQLATRREPATNQDLMSLTSSLEIKSSSEEGEAPSSDNSDKTIATESKKAGLTDKDRNFIETVDQDFGDSDQNDLF